MCLCVSVFIERGKNKEREREEERVGDVLLGMWCGGGYRSEREEERDGGVASIEVVSIRQHTSGVWVPYRSGHQLGSHVPPSYS